LEIAAAEGKTTSAHPGKAPVDLGKAAGLTQAAINAIAQPIYASMTDHKPTDTGLNQAKTMIAISKGGEKSVDAGKAPVNRAIVEAQTLGAITSGKVSLKPTETKAKEGLSKEEIASLQAVAEDEKKRAADAKVFGGGDAKSTMPNLMAEINAQNGASISVPTGKAPEGNISLNHSKTLMEIGNMKGQAIFASMQDHKPADTALDQAKTMIAISKSDGKSVAAGKAPVDRAINEALTMKAIGSDKKKASLKHIDAPDTSLSKEKLAELQALSIEEKKETS
jgi:hypothetical protein